MFDGTPPPINISQVTDALLTIRIAEHQRRLIKHFRPPAKVIWITVRPCDHLRFEFVQGYKTQVSMTVRFRF